MYILMACMIFYVISACVDDCLICDEATAGACDICEEGFVLTKDNICRGKYLMTCVGLSVTLSVALSVVLSVTLSVTLSVALSVTLSMTLSVTLR